MNTWLRDHNYWTVLLAQIFLLFVAALMFEHILLYVLFVLTLLAIFGAIIGAIWRDKKLPKKFAIAFGAVAIVGGFLWLIPGVPESVGLAGLIVYSFSYAAFILIAIVSIGRHVFITDRVTTNRIVGSICLYLLFGMFFAFLYAGISRVHPGSFAIGGTPVTTPFEGFRDFLYFSYSTLATMGSADMVALHPIPKVLTIIEAMAGPIYLAIMVARLVGMHITQHHQPAK